MKGWDVLCTECNERAGLEASLEMCAVLCLKGHVVHRIAEGLAELEDFFDAGGVYHDMRLCMNDSVNIGGYNHIDPDWWEIHGAHRLIPVNENGYREDSCCVAFEQSDLNAPTSHAWGCILPAGHTGPHKEKP